MKRSTVLVLTGVMTMFLGACGDNSKPSLPSAPTPTAATITTPEQNNKEGAGTTEQVAPAADVRADAGSGSSMGNVPDMGASEEDAPADEAPADEEIPST